MTLKPLEFNSAFIFPWEQCETDDKFVILDFLITIAPGNPFILNNALTKRHCQIKYNITNKSAM